MEKFFKLKQRHTDVRTEVLAGVTTFLTMIYILVVNPSILADGGMDWGAVFTATALSAAIATLVMGFYANLPFALAPGMGLNAFLAYSVVIGMGYHWSFALGAVFIEGIIFIILTAFNIREAIVQSLPESLKKAISVGIGLFIAFIGLQNAGIISANPSTCVELHLIKSAAGTYGPAVAIIGLFVCGALLLMKVPAALLIGIVITTIIGVPFGVTVWNPGHLDYTAPSMGPTFAACLKGLSSVNGKTMIDFLFVMFTFLFVDMFDTVGTLIGCAMKGGMVTKEGSIPNCKEALFADAVGTTVGALFGTSTVTTFVESSSGVIAGGRTGLTAVTVAVLFLASLFLAPLFSSVPSAATAPVLILVGLFMITPIVDMDFSHDYSEAIPSFLCIVMMPLAYSISDGIMFGVISYVILKFVKRDYRRALNPPTVVVFLLFVMKIILNNIH